MRNGKRPIPSLILQRQSRRRGFTLLELTVVIGIILVLLSMAVVGYRHLEAAASRDRTRVALHNAEAMLAEVDRVGGMIRIEGPSGTGAPYSPNTSTTPPTPPTLASPGDVTTANVTGRNAANGYCTTVLGILVQNPANQGSIAQLPAKSLVVGWTRTINGVQVPAIADAWGNPIIYVPSGGLTGVTVNGNPVTIKSPDGRPFWASAGPDGNFTVGDDNMYSFEK